MPEGGRSDYFLYITFVKLMLNRNWGGRGQNITEIKGDIVRRCHMLQLFGLMLGLYENKSCKY